jgi:pyridinium-3,5-biscarboxylic acid mononucleotide sulfurtransferase
MNNNKWIKLDKILQELGSFVVAYSGGVDSSLLLHRAHSIRNVNMIGVTIKTPYIPEHEINEALDFAKSFGIKHTVVDLSFPDAIRYNPTDRCYTCKKILFSELTDYAEVNGYKYIIEGTNSDDTGEYRPGLKALAELGIRSPLLEAGLTKKEIREFSRNEGLPTWDKPAMACLLTRVPYDTEVNEGVLGMIEKAETFLLEKGYPGARVRVHGDLARIECLPDFFEKIVTGPEKDILISSLKKIGFRYISLDLEGYRSGSFNPDNAEA